jgi:hypothetical protein
MTEKTTMKSSFYYREPGKHVMGPLPLGTLQVAQQSGSLNQSAEVSRDGNEPWVLLTVVLESRDKAFVQQRSTGSDDGITGSRKESKGMSPLVVAGLVVVALGVGAFAMRHFGQSRNAAGSATSSSDPNGSKVNAAGVKVNEEQVKAAAISCLFWAKSAISSKQEVEAAEVELSEQRSAGESQLKAIKLQEAKTDREESIKDFKEKLDELVSLEERAGIAGDYSKAIRDFVDYGERLATRAELTKKYKSILDPEYRAQYEEFSHLRWKIELDEVLDGSYKNGLGAVNR